MSIITSGAVTFSFPVRVYYEDTDAAGVVYYANYLKFFERARTEWLRQLGIEQNRLAATQGVVFVVRSANIQYRAPARLDDQLTIQSQITRLGRASLEFEQSCLRDDALLAMGHIQIGCVAADSLRPVAIPDDIRQHFQGVSAIPVAPLAGATAR